MSQEENPPRLRAKSRPVRIAVVTYITGRAAGPFGIPARNAAELMIETINAGDILPDPYAAPGLGGRPVRFNVYDEGGTREAQIKLFRQLHSDGIDVVLGYAGSGTAMDIAPIAEQLGVLTIISGGGTSQLFAQNSWDWVFRTQTTTTADSVGAALYVSSLAGQPVQSYGGINQDYEWGVDSWNEFSAALNRINPMARNLGGNFAPLYSGAVDAPLRALSARKAGLVHSGNWGEDVFRLVHQAAGMPDAPRLLLVAAESAMHRLAAVMPEGTIIGGRGSHGLLANDTALNRWFAREYRQRYEIAPIYPSYGVANALLGLKAAWDKAGGAAITRDVRDTLAGSKFEGIGSSISMARARGRQAVAEAAYATVARRSGSTVPALENLRRFASDLVTPPDGESALDWIRRGMPAGE